MSAPLFRLKIVCATPRRSRAMTESPTWNALNQSMTGTLSGTGMLGNPAMMSCRLRDSV